MSFAGLWQRPSPLYCRPRYNPRPLIIWEEDIWGEAWEERAATGEDTAAWAWHRIFLAVADLATHLDISTIVTILRFGITNLAVSVIAIICSVVIAISIAMIGSSAIITTVSSSILISLRLASLDATPTTPTMGTCTIIPIL